MGTVITVKLILLILAAVLLAVRSLRRRKGCGCGRANCSGCTAQKKAS